MIKPNHPVVFLAPGSGLGHLVRAGALALELGKEKVPCLTVSSSPWGEGFSRITGLGVIHVPPSRWKEDIPDLVSRIEPRLLVLDSFPMGFRGEKLKRLLPCPVVYLARHLKFNAYVNAIETLGGGGALKDMTAILIEDLADDHLAWIKQNTKEKFHLDGRIRFPVDVITAPEVPVLLRELLETDAVHLVVHSGPDHEVRRLIDRAQTAMRSDGKGRLAVINPRLAAKGEPGCFDYFPASLLYAKAHRIYSGAGYNSVAEAQNTTDKHVVIPFERRYDDQFWRVEKSNQSTGSGNGRRQAADVLFRLME